MRQPTVSAAEHPIVPGFYSDPTICRVGEDYYLAHSSFEYFPGAPIFHSRDLVSWRQIGNILDRRSQFLRGDGRASGGIYGSTLRHHDGRFHFVTTNVGDAESGQTIVTAEDPAGPWSDPVFVREAVGIDPDLCWDEDGECYLTWKGTVFNGEGDGIFQGRLDLETGRFKSEPYQVWQGLGLAASEAPHLYRVGDRWYLMLAEGGTERGHTVTVARADRPEGPYEACPANPIFSHRSLAHPVQNTGHADLVETAEGEWAAVYLAVRPLGFTPQFHVLGRETFLAGIDWVDGWPVFDEGRHSFTAPDTSFGDEFASPALDPRWVAPSSEPEAIASPHPGGGLELRDPKDDSPGLLCFRVQDHRWSATAAFTGSGRFELRIDDRHRYGLRFENGLVTAYARIGGVTADLGSAPAPGGEAVLAIRAVECVAETLTAYGPDDVVLSLGGADPVELARLDGRYLSTEVATGFTGRVLGVGAVGGASRLTAVDYRADRLPE
ncbi:glycoside hydrolase family 43 protein [Glycomyces paridis]|uniref:Glycoside hydrolase family 43 protein n=1 Tax=Glycomyces paridis TaxID=2126555 RepID=A0A4S8PEQ6_9ACTN|nr:glycoside hydrolase family 43 protein [Glycomyces paridis]THV26814.1 glycoside hydrolase family 43 protein [Glycomyces paridis]